ncbi:hypothetical protein [Synechococcus sp. UW105]|nr:hypothetical protein [Synechococcus sp. UW105]
MQVIQVSEQSGASDRADPKTVVLSWLLGWYLSAAAFDAPTQLNVLLH